MLVSTPSGVREHDETAAGKLIRLRNDLREGRDLNRLSEVLNEVLNEALTESLSESLSESSSEPGQRVQSNNKGVLMRFSSFASGAVALAAAAVAMQAGAAEYPIGKQQIQGGMEIGAVYLQPITMEPEGMMRKASDSDVHLEADIHAVKNNPTGFAEGD